MCDSQQGEVDSSQIDSLLMSWNLKRVTVPGDGNCLFTSIAFSLVQRAQRGDTFTSEHLLALGVPANHIHDVNYVQKLLRVRMVEEWNTNQEYYQGFLTVDITTLTHEYLQNGHFSGCVGDLRWRDTKMYFGKTQAIQL